jgi:hypothetical protein
MIFGGRTEFGITKRSVSKDAVLTFQRSVRSPRQRAACGASPALHAFFKPPYFNTLGTFRRARAALRSPARA